MAVPEDSITFRACDDAQDGVLQYVWDFDADVNADEGQQNFADANRNGVNESFDDEDAAGFNVEHAYPVERYDATSRDMIVTEWSQSEGAVAGGNVTVHLKEVYVTSGWGPTPSEQATFNDNANMATSSFAGMGYLVDKAHAAPLATVSPSTGLRLGATILPYHNIFMFFGHSVLDGNSFAGLLVNDPSGSDYNYQPLMVVQDRFAHPTPAGGSRTYRFVLLSCCQSYNSDMQQRFAAESFVGWDGTPWPRHINCFLQKFFEYLETGETTWYACRDAAGMTGGYADGATPKCSGSVLIKK